MKKLSSAYETKNIPLYGLNLKKHEYPEESFTLLNHYTIKTNKSKWVLSETKTIMYPTSSHMSLDGNNWFLTWRWDHRLELSQEVMDSDLLQHWKEC